MNKREIEIQNREIDAKIARVKAMEPRPLKEREIELLTLFGYSPDFEGFRELNLSLLNRQRGYRGQLES